MQRILDRTHQLIPSDSCSLNWLTPEGASAMVAPRIDPVVFERLDPVFRRSWGENPLAQHFRRTGETRALTWTDVEGDDRWRGGRLYRDFYTPLGITDQLAVRLPSPPDVVVGLVCSRSTAFDQRDRDVLTEFGRQVAVRLGSMTEHSAMRSVFTEHGWRTLLVDDHARILGPPEADEPPLGQEPELRKALAGLVHVPADPPSRGRLVPGDPRPVRLSDGRRFTAFVVRGSIPPHLLFVREVDEAQRAPDSQALHSQGLTPRQADVATRLVTGCTNQEIAADLGITVGTVKKHMQRVFDIFGVHTRGAAAATVVELLSERRHEVWDSWATASSGRSSSESAG